LGRTCLKKQRGRLVPVLGGHIENVHEYAWIR
jgi:hypothetical protein